MGYRLDSKSERSGWVPEPPEAAFDALRQERQPAKPKQGSVSVRKQRRKQTSMDEPLVCRCGHLPQEHRRRAGSCNNCDCRRYQLRGPARVRPQYLPRDPDENATSREKRMRGPFG
ncbi:MAG: hypothetical protein J2P45_11740 [Candidatus Dormibacteraeota bacterium]|nr:hypothetical protein [Candidatus Dormibacteraeota bacterium]